MGRLIPFPSLSEVQIMETEVLKRVPEWNTLHQKTNYFLTATDEKISAGLALRIHNYALEQLKSAGFFEIVKGWVASVYTCDGDDRPSNRSYCVRWTNVQGGYIEVVGILTYKGWPNLDHGLAIGR